MLLVNEILHNRYRIIRQLGHGGMGAVYEVQDNVFDTTCALKEIMLTANSQNAKQQEMLLRAFEREAKILAKIKHEVVPHVRDYFMDENRQFLVMELIEGKDLGDLLDERKSAFPLEDVLRWTDQLLDGLDYLHTQNPPIYHRDLKPQNLKITPRGKIKLLDFGIAKGGAEVPNSSTINNNQTFVAATLNYSPIEQIFRVLDPVFREVLTQRFESRIQAVMLQNADARSDLYALGATAYHLMTGFLPIDSLKRTIEVWADKKDPLDHPTTLNSHIPPEISNVLLKAMELDHDRRYVSAIEMQQALQQAAADVKARESNQSQNTLEMSRSGWQTEQEKNRITGQQQQTRLGTGDSFQGDATQQIPADKLPPFISQQAISEQTIQSGGINQPPNFGQNTGGAVQNQNNQFNTGGTAPQYNTGGQYQSGGNIQQTEMANFAGVQTGGNVPPPNFPNNQFNTGGAMNSNNSLTPNAGYMPNQTIQPAQKASKAWWILPIILLLFLGVAGAGGGLFLWYNSDKGTTANVNASPSATVSATKTPASSPSVTPSVAPSVNNGKEETPKPTTEPTTTKPVITNTPPPPQIRTPPPVRPQKTKPNATKQNSDCIFTGC